jgi:hypothetical protein
MIPNPAERPEGGWACWQDDEVVEQSLLLPAWQAEALEIRALARGLTTGQLLRLLIQDYLTGPRDPDRRTGRKKEHSSNPVPRT